MFESFATDNILRKYTKWFNDKQLYLEYKLPRYSYRYFPVNEALINYFATQIFPKYDDNAALFTDKDAYEQAYFGDVNKRNSYLGYTIFKRDTNTFIKLLTSLFPELKQTGFDKIKDEDFEVIPIEKARSKKYETYYMFWEDMDGNLQAITKENKIHAVFYSYGPCYKVNKDYICHDIKGLIDDCDNDCYKAAKLYVDEAYKIEDIYNIATAKEIKNNIMKNNNVITLQKACEQEDPYMENISTINGYRWFTGISKIYGISFESFAKYRDESKLQNRKEYKEFLIKQMMQMENKIKNYKKNAAIIKYDREYENTIKAMDNAMQVIRKSCNMLRRLQLKNLLADNYKETIPEDVYKNNNVFDQMGDGYKRMNEFYMDLINSLSYVQYNIGMIKEYTDKGESTASIYMMLNNIKSYLSNYNENIYKLRDAYSYYARGFNTIKLVLTPEEEAEILKIEDTGIYTIVKKEQ